MARLVLRRTSLRQFIGPTLLYALGCSVALFTAWAFGNAWVPVLVLAGAVAVLLTWRMAHWPDTWSRYMSFGALLLLVCLLNRAFSFADYFVSGTQLTNWPFFAADPQRAVFKGEVLATVGPLLTVLAWRQCGGLKISPAVVLEQPRRTYHVLQIIYVLALLGMAVSERIPRVAALTGQLLPTLLALGLVSTFLLPMTRFKREPMRLLATMLLGAPFIALAAGTGMKENIILSIIPVAVMAWRCFRHPVVRASLVLTGLAALALITAYVNLYRAEVWKPQSAGTPVSQTVPQDFAHQVRTNGVSATIGDGLVEFVKRSDSSEAHGWAVAIADERGFQPRLVLGPLTYVFIPRMIWHNKPPIRTGWEFSGLVFGEHYIWWSQSSTASGFYPALYLGWGWPAFVAGALLAGVLLAVMSRLALRYGGSLAAGLYIFSLVPFMLRMNANWPDGVLAAPVIALVYVLAITKVAGLLARVAFRARHSSAAPA